ncbi:Uncharacterised protein [Mycobacteroides abscessus subsp. abscessus]|nr:Uncharacterised protein [Mycobacteroides abscessus subsp. abscessus]
MEHHAPLEQQHQRRRVPEIAQVVGVPLLVARHSEDAVADVTVLADDVGERVVHVVVAVAPLLGGAHGVPLEFARVVGVFTHPVVLAVHDVVPDLHVVEDLGHAQRADARDPRGREPAEEQQSAAGDLETTLRADDRVQVFAVLRAEVGDDPRAHLVEVATERFDLLVAQVKGVGVRRPAQCGRDVGVFGRGDGGDSHC